ALVGGEPFVEIGLLDGGERPLGDPQTPGGGPFFLIGNAVVVVLGNHACCLIRRARKTSAREICLSTVRRWNPKLSAIVCLGISSTRYNMNICCVGSGSAWIAAQRTEMLSRAEAIRKGSKGSMPTPPSLRTASAKCRRTRSWRARSLMR